MEWNGVTPDIETYIGLGIHHFSLGLSWGFGFAFSCHCRIFYFILHDDFHHRIDPNVCQLGPDRWHEVCTESSLVALELQSIGICVALVVLKPRFMLCATFVCAISLIVGLHEGIRNLFATIDGGYEDQ